MYLEKLVTLLTNLYSAYTPYAIGLLVVVIILFYFKTKAMAKLIGLVLVIIGALYLAGLFMEGVSSSSEKKKAMTEKSKLYDQ
jgi:predicted RND superfamily exporter protein